MLKTKLSPSSNFWLGLFNKNFFHCSVELEECIGRNFFYPNEFIMVVDECKPSAFSVSLLGKSTHCEDLITKFLYAKRTKRNKDKRVDIVRLPTPNNAHDQEIMVKLLRYLREKGIEQNQITIVFFQEPKNPTNSFLNPLLQEVDLGLTSIDDRLWVSKERNRVDKGNMSCTTV